MTPLEIYRTRFDEHAWQVFRRVLQSALQVGHAEITETHLITELLDTEREVFAEFFSQFGIEPIAFRAHLVQQMNTKAFMESEPLRLDPNLIELLKCAWNRALAQGRDRITTMDLLATLAQISGTTLVRLLDGFGVDLNQTSSAMLACLERREKDAGISVSEVADSGSSFRQGDVVHIKSGPFLAFSGRVRQVNPSRSTVTVSINALGKLQTVELMFSQVQKLTFT